MAEMKRWVIIGAGPISEYEKIKAKLNDNDFICCADGGTKHLSSLGISPDLVMGDFDSSQENAFDCEILTFPVEKDDTDMLLALKEGIKRGGRSFLLIGGTGGRLDHTFANFQTLLYAEKHGASAALCDENNFAFILKNDTAFIEKNEGEKVSLFAFDGPVGGVSLEGFYYPLKNASLFGHYPLAISNFIISDKGRITVSKGTLLVIISNENQ